MQDDYCVGRYGFTIKYDGTFTAGPSDGGIKTEGRIKLPELKQLRDLIAEVSPGALGESKECHSEGLPGIRDQVDIMFGSGAVVRVYDLGGRIGKVCYAGSWDWVSKFHENLSGLMLHYYPVPFPKS